MKFPKMIALLLSIPFFALWAMAQNPTEDLTDNLVKVKSKWGEPCTPCNALSDTTYVAYYKSKSPKNLDVMIGVRERGGWWRLATFYGVTPADTMRVFGCKGTGKTLKWARYANDPSFKFPTQSEVNEQYK